MFVEEKDTVKQSYYANKEDIISTVEGVDVASRQEQFFGVAVAVQSDNGCI